MHRKGSSEYILIYRERGYAWDPEDSTAKLLELTNIFIEDTNAQLAYKTQ